MAALETKGGLDRMYKILDDTPWTCGDCRIAIEYGEELGHTEILIPIQIGDEIVAYMPWEPLAGNDRQVELRANIRRVAETLDRD